LSVYADTSVFVSSFLKDAHSPDVARRLAAGPLLWLTPLHRAEWTSAVAQHVFRRSISAQEAQIVFEAFERNRAAGQWIEVAMPPAAFEIAVELSQKYTVLFGTRALDTLHVAAALQLDATEFWTFDDRQAKLATAAGLNVA